MDNAIKFKMATKIERVAAYCRVSTEEQKQQGISIQAQQMKLSEYAEANKMKIVGWYIDEGVSHRKPIKDRPALQRMIEDTEKGLFSRIIFTKMDRFFRTHLEYYACMDRIEPIIWSTTEESFDMNTDAGRMAIAELLADSEKVRLETHAMLKELEILKKKKRRLLAQSTKQN